MAARTGAISSGSTSRRRRGTSRRDGARPLYSPRGPITSGPRTRSSARSRPASRATHSRCRCPIVCRSLVRCSPIRSRASTAMPAGSRSPAARPATSWRPSRSGSGRCWKVDAMRDQAVDAPFTIFGHIAGAWNRWGRRWRPGTRDQSCAGLRRFGHRADATEACAGASPQSGGRGAPPPRPRRASSPAWLARTVAKLG